MGVVGGDEGGGGLGVHARLYWREKGTGEEIELREKREEKGEKGGRGPSLLERESIMVWSE